MEPAGGKYSQNRILVFTHQFFFSISRGKGFKTKLEYVLFFVVVVVVLFLLENELIF